MKTRPIHSPQLPITDPPFHRATMGECKFVFSLDRTSKRFACRFLSMLALFCMFVGITRGDTITGTVYDDANGNGSRQSYEGALVNRLVMLGAVDNESKFGARTDEKGNFTIPDVPNGRYRLVIESLGEKITQPVKGFYDVLLPNPNPKPYLIGAHDSCIEYGKIGSTFQPLPKEGCFDWDFTFTNIDQEPMTDLYFDVVSPVQVSPRDNPASMNHYAFSTPVQPGQTVTVKLTICGVKAGDCIDIPLFIVHKDGHCCQTTVLNQCLPVDQCVGIVNSEIKCRASGGYNWNLTIQNLGGSTVTKVALGSIRTTAGIVIGTPNPSFFNGLSIPNNGTYALPPMIIPPIPGGTIASITMVLFDKNGECCNYTATGRLPICPEISDCTLCAAPLDLLAGKPTFAKARKAAQSATSPQPNRFWKNYQTTVAARTFSIYDGAPSSVDNDQYSLAYIDMTPATATAPLLGDYVVPSFFDRQYHGPPDPNDPKTDLWKQKYLGTVFGTTIDRDGNTYVAHFGMYSNTIKTGVSPYTGIPWKFGSIFKIDNLTGEISQFATLPNDPISMPGLGNITYDYDHKLIFAANMEDGLIYRMPMTGNTSGVWTAADYYGPFTAEKPTQRDGDGMASDKARIFAIQYHCGRLYFSRFADTRLRDTAEENLIYSIPLDANGGFMPGLPTYEAGLSTPTSNVSIHRNPVSDISFSPEGRMGVAEMTIDYEAGAPQPFREGAHESKGLEYDCNQKGMWEASYRFVIGNWGLDCAGGLAYDPNHTAKRGNPYSPRLWFTGTNLNSCFTTNKVVFTGDGSTSTLYPGTMGAYGAAGFDPRPGIGGHSIYGPRTFADPAFLSPLPGDTIIIDYNGQGDSNWYSKRHFGDIEIPVNR